MKKILLLLISILLFATIITIGYSIIDSDNYVSSNSTIKDNFTLDTNSTYDSIENISSDYTLENYPVKHSDKSSAVNVRNSDVNDDNYSNVLVIYDENITEVANNDSNPVVDESSQTEYVFLKNAQTEYILLKNGEVLKVLPWDILNKAG